MLNPQRVSATVRAAGHRGGDFCSTRVLGTAVLTEGSEYGALGFEFAWMEDFKQRISDLLRVNTP